MKYIINKNTYWKNNAVKIQDSLLLSLVEEAKNTRFGKEHFFSNIKNFCRNKF